MTDPQDARQDIEALKRAISDAENAFDEATSRTHETGMRTNVNGLSPLTVHRLIQASKYHLSSRGLLRTATDAGDLEALKRDMSLYMENGALADGMEYDTGYCEDKGWNDCIDHLAPRLARTVPEGYALIPVDPDDAYVEKVCLKARVCGGIFESFHSAMISAAPQPPVRAVPDDKWKDIETAPKDGTAFYARFETSMRWLPYKKDARRQGYPDGRWQELGEYGGWKNTEFEPKEWRPHPSASPQQPGQGDGE